MSAFDAPTVSATPPAHPRIDAAGRTDRGQVREANEDAFFANPEAGVFAVADGLGGLPGGADASRRIVELLAESHGPAPSATPPDDLGEHIIAINHVVARESAEAHPFTGAGSTLTLLRLRGGEGSVAHVGDSAAYHWRDGELRKVTTDHTMEQEWRNRYGVTSVAEMPPEFPHTLTRCVGQSGELRVDQTRFPVIAGDRLLLCTDGLHKVLPPDTLGETLASGATAAAIADRLIELANAREGPDNITLIAILLH